MMCVGCTQPGSGRLCSGIPDQKSGLDFLRQRALYRAKVGADLRTWTRKNSLMGVTLRSELDAREAKVLRSLVESVCGLLDERNRTAPYDELAELTGLQTGNSAPPED